MAWPFPVVGVAAEFANAVWRCAYQTNVFVVLVNKKVKFIAYKQHFFSSILITDTPFAKAVLKSNKLVLDFRKIVSRLFEKRIEDFSLIHPRLGVMDDNRLISDYGLTEGSTLNFVFKISSGFKP